MAKILLLDIETAPSLGWVWGKYDQNVIKFKQNWFILSFAWKWLGDDGIQVKSLRQYRGYRKNLLDDKALLVDLWKLLDEADIIVAHNGDAFDVKKIQARFAYHRMGPTKPFKTVDTLKLLRKNFKLDSNALKDAAGYFGFGDKLPHHGFATWEGCIEGVDEEWDTMERYNIHDIVLLEPVYELVKAWGPHPNLTLYDVEKGNCPTCGSGDVQRRGLMHLKARSYQRFACQGCGHWFKGDYVKPEK